MQTLHVRLHQKGEIVSESSDSIDYHKVDQIGEIAQGYAAQTLGKGKLDFDQNRSLETGRYWFSYDTHNLEAIYLIEIWLTEGEATIS